MKLDLTREQRGILESAVDVIADLIEDKLQAKEDLLSKTYEHQGQYLARLYLNAKIADLKSDINDLLICKHGVKSLVN